MADYANALVTVVAIFGVINRVPAPAHNVFCYSAVALILTPSANLAFRPNRASNINVELGLGSGFKMRLFYNSVWVYMQGPTRGVEKIHPPPTNSKNRSKSFCEVLYQTFLLLVRRYQWRFW